ncbi:MAG: carbohydrate-binding family 9-like protein [Deltaproteobacteria bacterium]|nr:carbohydrate-binding family 9-like protein [Deltaproteobacteria bacterium]
MIRTLAAAAVVLITGCKGDGSGPKLDGVDRSDGTVPELRVVRGKPVAIDGKSDDAVWKSAASTGAFVHPADGKPRSSSKVNAEARLAYDDDALYLLLEVYDSEPSSPFARDDVDPHIWSRASGIELMLQPGDRADNRNYFEVQVDVAGAVWDTRFDDYNRPITGPKGNKRFGHQDWSARLERAVARDSDRYTVELALPWVAFEGVSAPTTGQVWKANLYSFRDGQRDSLSWSPILGKGNFHRASRFGRLRFE